MVQRFLLQCVLWSMPIAAGLLVYILVNIANVPAPKLTSNLALNEQLERIVGLPDKHVDVLAMGSSMTLNNLASAPVMKHFGTSSYQNSAAWGMGVKEVMTIAPPMLDRLTPKQVIMVTNLVDFMPGALITPEEAEAVRRYLEGGGSVLDHLRYWDAAYFLRQMELNRIRFNDMGNYEFLGFDAHGAATLEVPAERILPSRYNAPPPRPEDLDVSFYAAFGSFSALLRERNVDLLVIQSPFRKGLLDPAVKQMNQEHASRLRAILGQHGHHFVDGNALVWPDSLFTDATHLDHVAAYAFTQWALEQPLH